VRAAFAFAQHPVHSRSSHVRSIEQHKDHGDSSRGMISRILTRELIIARRRSPSETAKTRGITNQCIKRASDATERQTPKAEFARSRQQISEAELSRRESDSQSRICINHSDRSAGSNAHTVFVALMLSLSFSLFFFFPCIPREFVGSFEYRAPRFSLFLYSVSPAGHEHVLRALLQFYETPGTFFSRI